MPFQSKAQQRYLEAHPDKVGGRAKLREWEQATDLAKLPAKKGLMNRQLERVRNG